MVASSLLPIWPRDHFAVPVPPSPRAEKEITKEWKGSLDMPRVSIICDTFQHAPYVRDALNGFLMQITDFPFEIIVHDDASTDGTKEILEVYANLYPNIIRTILQDENQFSKGRRPPRFTFHKARGDYIALCEGDDYWLDPQKISKQCLLMDRHQSINICIHPGLQLILKDQTTRKFGYHGKKTEVKSLAEMLILPGQFCPTASIFMRHSSVASMPDWFHSADDLPVGDLFMEALLGVDGLLYVPDVMSLYRSGVPGSHTDRVANCTSQAVVSDYDVTIRSVSLLFEVPEMPANALKKRLSIIKTNYAFRFMALSDYDGFRYVMRAPPIGTMSLKMAVLQASAKISFLFYLLRACLGLKRAISAKSAKFLYALQ